MQATLKISDFSRLARVPTATLRYYDQLGLLKPAVVDRFTEYRYYTLEQLSRLNRILALKDLGFSLEDIERLVNRDVSVAELRGLLAERQAAETRELQETQARLYRLNARLNEIEQEGVPSPYDIALKEVEPAEIVSTQQQVGHLHEMVYFCDVLHGRLRDWMQQQRVKPLGLPAPKLLNLYHVEEYTETDLDVEAAVMLAPGQVISRAARAAAPFELTVRHLERCTVASAIHQGEMMDIDPMILALVSWIATNGYRMAGPVRELHYIRRANDPEATPLVELQFPIAPQTAD